MSRDSVEGRCRFRPNALQESDRGQVLNRKFHIARAAEILLPFVGKLPENTPEAPLPIKSFQDVLQIWPLSRDGETASLGTPDAKCPDCGGIFSSSDDLEQHCLKQSCPGAAIVVYVMILDRFITKGYRIEKKLLPLYGRPLRFLCQNCDEPFTVDDQRLNGQRNVPFFGSCASCGPKVTPLYIPGNTGNFDKLGCRRDFSIRPSGRRSSISRRSHVNPRYPRANEYGMGGPPAGVSGTSAKVQGRRDSLFSRRASQYNENELIAVSFAGPYDLERVYAPNGIYEPREIDTSGSWSSKTTAQTDNDGVSLVDAKRSNILASNKEGKDIGSISANPETNPSNDTPASEGFSTPKKPSLFRRVFGRKLAKRLFRADTVPRRRKSLTKRTNRVRFSYAAKRRKSHISVLSPSREGNKRPEPDLSKADARTTATPDPKHVALLIDCQSVFVHLQHHSAGLVVYDASGRQRVLSTSQVARLFMQVKDEISAGHVWSNIVAMRFRAESALRESNFTAAVSEYRDALRLLDDTPALDVYRLSRAGMLHELGQAYCKLGSHVGSEACYLEALGLYKQSLGRDHAKNFTILHELGALCEEDGYAVEAAAMYQRSFAGRLRMLGQSAPETLSSMLDLAAVKVSFGDLEAPLLLLEKAVSTLDRIFGIKNEMTLNTMDKLSILYHKLGLEAECHDILAKIIPHCQTFFGKGGAITRDAVTRYIKTSENFDFPTEIKDILDQYRKSRELDSLLVIHRLGRAYMDAGLNREAAELFEGVLDDMVALKGTTSREAFDTLSAFCVCLENLGNVDRAVDWYSLLVHIASKTHDRHHSRKKIGYAEKRIAELTDQRKALVAEKTEWGLDKPGACATCGCPTSVLCTTCKTTHFCTKTCQKLSSNFHSFWCIPSTTPQESKSVTVKPTCPDAVLNQAIFQINSFEGNSGDANSEAINVTQSYGFYLDPHNFSTLRIKLKENVNTVVVFPSEPEPEHIRYAILQSASAIGSGGYCQAGSTSSSSNASLSPNVTLNTNRSDSSSSFGSSSNTDAAAETDTEPESDIDLTFGYGVNGDSDKTERIEWITPQTKPSFHFTPLPPPSQFETSSLSTPAGMYLLVSPGREMLETLIERRLRVRSSEGERDQLSRLGVPDKDLIEYAQGLPSRGHSEEAFMYVVEWVWGNGGK